jgi:hypothetical protein
LNHQSPYVKLLHKNPDYTLLKVFSCACFPLLRPYNNHKLLYRSQKCIFLGYCSNYKGYRCYNPTSKKTIISRHVVFDENTFPAKDWISSLPQPTATDAAPVQVSPSTRVSATLNLTPVITANDSLVSTVSSPTISIQPPHSPSSPVNTSPSASSSTASPISLPPEPYSSTLYLFMHLPHHLATLCLLAIKLVLHLHLHHLLPFQLQPLLLSIL